MEFLLDTANLAEIKKYVAIAPIAGVTSNPTIVKKEGQIDFFNHMKAIRDIIGLDKTLHVQVVAQDVAGIVADAHAILANIDKEVLTNIFTPYEKGVKGVFGLGLSIVKKTLAFLDYDINIVNEKNGVKFIIS